jgi:hypothetical protein
MRLRTSERSGDADATSHNDDGARRCADDLSATHELMGMEDDLNDRSAG